MKRIIAFAAVFGLFGLGIKTLIAGKRPGKKQSPGAPRMNMEDEPIDSSNRNVQKRIHGFAGLGKDRGAKKRLSDNRQAKEEVSPLITKSGSRRPTDLRSHSSGSNRLTNEGADKIIGTDERGRTIYEGKRGGHYYMDNNGNKEYTRRS